MSKSKKPSIADLSETEAMEDIGGLDEGELPEKGKDHNPGRSIYRRELNKFSKMKEEDKHTMLRETWKEVAMGAASRAKAFVATCSPRDFGTLQRLVVSGAIAIDKAFPQKAEVYSPKFIVNMFGSLGPRAVAIAQPLTPIDITPKEVTCDSAMIETVASLPIPKDP